MIQITCNVLPCVEASFLFLTASFSLKKKKIYSNKLIAKSLILSTNKANRTLSMMPNKFAKQKGL